MVTWWLPCYIVWMSAFAMSMVTITLWLLMLLIRKGLCSLVSSIRVLLLYTNIKLCFKATTKHAHIYFSGQKFTKLKIKIRHILLLNYINCFKKLSWYAHNLNLSHCTRSVVTYCLHVARLQLELALWR